MLENSLSFGCEVSRVYIFKSSTVTFRNVELQVYLISNRVYYYLND